MSYKVLARRTRPQTFADVVGQSATVTTLQRSLEQNKLHQAYLLTGTRGVGKTSIARILAKCMNCEQELSSTPCGSCDSCVGIADGNFVDLIEIDAASHTKVEDIRTILDNIPYRPNNARYKVYLIDEVHMLSNHSFNALLKTLEEPPEYVKFILCTTDPQKLPATILSRCLRFHLHNLSPEEIKQHLDKILQQEKINFSDEATLILAEAADGSVRDSLSLLDQAIAFCDGEIKSEQVKQMLGMSDSNIIDNLLLQIAAEDASAALKIVEQMAEQGENFQTAAQTLLREYHKQAIKLALTDSQDVAKNQLVHLCYEIVLNGLKGIALAPTMRIGFEIMVLRLLAFQPAQASFTMPVPKVAVSTKQTTPAPQVEHNQQQAAQSAQPAKQLAFEWTSGFINQLNLRGISLEIAKNCSLRQITDSVISFSLSNEHASLFTEKQRLRIQESINQCLQSSFDVQIDIQELSAESSITPRKSEKQAEESNMAKMTELVTKDANSQRIIDAFSATIVTGSIRSHEAQTTTIGDEYE